MRVGRVRYLRGLLLLAPTALASLAMGQPAPEEIVVLGEKREPRLIQNVVMEYLPRQRVVLVGVDEQRNTSLVSSLEDAALGEPPWGALDDHIRKICVENRFG